MADFDPELPDSPSSPGAPRRRRSRGEAAAEARPPEDRNPFLDGGDPGPGYPAGDRDADDDDGDRARAGNSTVFGGAAVGDDSNASASSLRVGGKAGVGAGGVAALGMPVVDV